MLKPSSCSGCALEHLSNGFTEPEGEGTSGVVIVGEGAGYNEYIDGKPFRPKAQAGSKLEEAFRLVGKDLGQPVSRNQFLLYNIVQCNPFGDKLAGMSYEQSAIAQCSSNVDRVVGGFKTHHNKTILALGNIPLKTLTGFSGIADEKQSISHLRGYVFQSKYGLVVPSLHPSFIRRGNNHLTPLLVADLKKAMAVARGTYTNYNLHSGYVPPQYQTSPGLDEAWSFYYKVKDSPKRCLTYDIETEDTAGVDEDERDELTSKEIIQIQFSIAKNSGIAFPWNETYLPVIKALFELPIIKANQNTWNFDNPIIKSKGVEINGVIHDLMWMFKHWHPRLPRGLQSSASLFGFPQPWKHLFKTSLAHYGICDVDADQYLLHSLPPLMKAKGIWEGYKRHVLGLHVVLDRATETGIPVNEEKRLALEKDFKERRAKLDKEIQSIVPDEVRNIKPRRKLENGEFDYGYIREPKIIRSENDNYERLYKRLSSEGKHCVSFEEYLFRKHNLAYCQFEKVVGNVRTNFERWAVVEPFKASSTQLIKYLNWKRDQLKQQIEELRVKRSDEFQGRNPEITSQIRELEELYDDYEVPTNLKTKKETTSKKELEEMFLNTGDSLLEKVVQIRSYDTNINNFIPNWKPGKDGKVHPQYGFAPPQGQINSWSPNSQNVSKHTEFGNEFRGIIEAPVGYVFLEADKKSFHVGTMGYCANDKSYIRYSQIDPHSILGSHIDPSIIGQSISLKWTDSEIREAAGEFKKRSKQKPNGVDVRQELAKPTVLGNQLELGPVKLQRQNRRYIEYVYEATRIANKGKGYSAEGLQRIVADMFPKVEAYKVRVKEKAHVDKELISEWGRVQHFYNVYNFTFDKKTHSWRKKDGDEARFPIAFMVQGTAFGMITEEILRMEEEGICEEHNFITTIHDSAFFLVEEKKLDRAIVDIYRNMSMPCKQLVNEATGPEGLVIGVEIAIGRNWKGWDKDKNPDGMKELKI